MLQAQLNGTSKGKVGSMVADGCGTEMAVETITPELAKDLLQSNFKNRNLRTPEVKKLAEEMKAGRWRLNGETIKLGPNWELLDGQHRLHACIRAGVSFQTYVAYNVPPEHFRTIDIGVRRSPGDVLGMEGYKNSRDLAAAARWLIAHERGALSAKHVKLTPYEIAEYVDENPELDESLKACYGVKKIGAPTSVMAAFYHLFRQKDQQLADEFIDDFVSGDSLSQYDSVKLLRERFMMQDRRNRLDPTEAAALIIRAWNARRTGEQRKYLKGRIFIDKNKTPKLPEIV